jgi:hypothetical protein
MKWQPIETAPKNYLVLVRFGTKASGNLGYSIASLINGYWYDDHNFRIETEGYEVTGWMLLPPLD